LSRIRDLPRKDFIALIISIMIPCTVFLASVYQVYLSNVEYEAEFKVFAVNVDYWPELRGNQTQVLTWGTGKYYFIGTWTDTFQLDHSYRVRYVRKPGSSRPWQHLIILEWEMIE